MDFRFSFPNVSYPSWNSSSNSSWNGTCTFGNENLGDRNSGTTSGARAENRSWNAPPPPYTTNFEPYNYGGVPQPPPPYNFGPNQGGFGSNPNYGGGNGNSYRTSGNFSTSFGYGGNDNKNDDKGTDKRPSSNTDDKDFEVKINVSNYSPEELNVKTIDSTVVIVEGNKQTVGTHTSSSRNFQQSYHLPPGIPPENLQCRLTSDGYLILSAARPKNQETKNDGKNVKITNDPKVAAGAAAASASTSAENSNHSCTLM